MGGVEISMSVGERDEYCTGIYDILGYGAKVRRKIKDQRGKTDSRVKVHKSTSHTKPRQSDSQSVTEVTKGATLG